MKMMKTETALAKPIVLRVVVGEQGSVGLAGTILSPENIVLHQHFSSNRDWLAYDLYQGERAKARLDAIYPEGYSVVWE